MKKQADKPACFQTNMADESLKIGCLFKKKYHNCELTPEE